MNAADLSILNAAIEAALRATGLHMACTRKPVAVECYGETLTNSSVRVVLVDVAYRAVEPWRALWEIHLDWVTGEPVRTYLAAD